MFVDLYHDFIAISHSSSHMDALPAGVAADGQARGLSELA